MAESASPQRASNVPVKPLVTAQAESEPECAVIPAENVPAKPLPVMAVRWRVEVQKRGRYWQWRSGRGALRQSRYGGKFALLSDERKAQYEQNKERRERVTNNGT